MIGTVETTEPMTVQDAIVLTVSKEKDYSDGVTEAAKIKEFENCGAPGSVESIEAGAACIEGDATRATFEFDVSVKGGLNKAQTFYYAFSSRSLSGEEIKDVQVLLDGKKIDGASV